MSNIIFLGTGGDASVIGRQLRGSGGIVIQSGDSQLHIDPGPGALVRAKEFGVNVRATTAILLSDQRHFYSNDVNALIDGMTLGGLDKQGVLLTNQHALSVLSEIQRGYLEKVLLLENNNRVGIENIEVTGIPTMEGSHNAFVITLPSVVIGYTGDTAYTASLAKSLADCNVLIVSMPHPGDKKEGKRMNRVDAVKLIERVKPQLAILTHFGLDLLKSDPLEESRAIQRATGVQTIAAHDGLQVTPANYDAKNRQKRLGSFTPD